MESNFNMKSKQTIGERLRNIRLDARLTQKEMSKLVGLAPGSIGAMENDLYTPSYDFLRAIKERLGVSYDYVIDGVKTDGKDLRSENEKLRQEVDRLTKIVDKLLK
jgi:transcriptional regulator with XRE-family HTH domain